MSHSVGPSRCACDAPATRLVKVLGREADDEGVRRVPVSEKPARVATCEAHRHLVAGELKAMWHREIAARQVSVVIGPKRRRGLG